MTSREASRHRVAIISAELYRAVVKMQAAITPAAFDQLDRSTLSIGSNLVEAFGRSPEASKDRSRFLRYARASAYEAAFQLDAIGEHVLADWSHEVSDLLDEMLSSEIVTPVSVETPDA